MGITKYAKPGGGCVAIIVKGLKIGFIEIYGDNSLKIDHLLPPATHYKNIIPFTLTLKRR